MLKGIGVRVSFRAPHDSFLAQFGRAAPRHGEGHWFKSSRNYQTNLCPCGQIGKVGSLKRSSSVRSNRTRGTNALVVKWHNTVLVRLNRKFDSFLEHHFTRYKYLYAIIKRRN